MKQSIEELIRKTIKQVVNEQPKESNYMFFSNLEQMKRQCEMLLELDRSMVDGILQNGHDWADDHITAAKENIDQVFDFLMNQTKGGEMDESLLSEEYQIDESKNVPTNPKLWSRAKAAAKAKYDVYPSALANGFASKWYKERGGGWKKKSKKK